MKDRRFMNRWLLVLLFLTSTLSACASKRPVLLGFAGELTGRQSDMGVHGRNAAELAVADLNAAGGIAGRPVELLVRDDLGTPEGARAADRELIEAGVVAIVGHMTSGQSVAAVPVIDEARVVLMGPTTSTSRLAGLDDYFFRVTATTSTVARVQAEHIYRRRGLSRVAIAYSTDNEAFTQDYGTAFAEAYRDFGGEVVAYEGFSSFDETLDFTALMAALQRGDPHGLLIIAPAFETAFLAQQLRLHDIRVPLFATGWSQTQTLIANGGQAVEGLEIVRIYVSDSDNPAFMDFEERYRARFGQAPSFAAAQTYEAVRVLAAALEKTGGRAKGLREALLEIREFEGLIGPIFMDAYGDVVRPYFLLRIEDGQFVPIGVLESEMP